MMSDCVCKIERLENGYEIEITDPAIVAYNEKRNTKGNYAPYKDPKRSYAFKSVEEVCNFLRKNLDKATASLDEYGTAFVEAAEKDDD